MSTHNHEAFDPPLDPGIAAYVVALRKAGVETYESCEGGDDHAFPVPTVRFHGAPAEGLRALAVALAHDLPVATVRRVWDVVRGEATGPTWEMTFVHADPKMAVEHRMERLILGRKQDAPDVVQRAERAVASLSACGPEKLHETGPAFAAKVAEVVASGALDRVQVEPMEAAALRGAALRLLKLFGFDEAPTDAKLAEGLDVLVRPLLERIDHDLTLLDGEEDFALFPQKLPGRIEALNKAVRDALTTRVSKNRIPASGVAWTLIDEFRLRGAPMPALPNPRPAVLVLLAEPLRAGRSAIRWMVPEGATLVHHEQPLPDRLRFDALLIEDGVPLVRSCVDAARRLLVPGAPVYHGLRFGKDNVPPLHVPGWESEQAERGSDQRSRKPVRAVIDDALAERLRGLAAHRGRVRFTVSAVLDGDTLVLADQYVVDSTKTLMDIIGVALVGLRDPSMQVLPGIEATLRRIGRDPERLHDDSLQVIEAVRVATSSTPDQTTNTYSVESANAGAVALLSALPEDARVIESWVAPADCACRGYAVRAKSYVVVARKPDGQEVVALYGNGRTIVLPALDHPTLSRETPEPKRRDARPDPTTPPEARPPK